MRRRIGPGPATFSTALVALLAELPGDQWSGAGRGFVRGVSMGLLSPTLMPDEEGWANTGGELAGTIAGFTLGGMAGVGRGLVSGLTRLPRVMCALGKVAPEVAKTVGHYAPAAQQALSATDQAALRWAWPARTALGAAMGGVSEYARQTRSPEAELREALPPDPANPGPTLPERVGGIAGQSALGAVAFGLPGAIASGISLGARGGNAMLQPGHSKPQRQARSPQRRRDLMPPR